jgi:hypothetical protein
MAKTLSDLLVPAGNAPTLNQTIQLPDKEKRNEMVAWLQGQPGQTVHIAKLDRSPDSYCLAERKLVKGCTHVATVTDTGEFHAVKQSKPPTDAKGRLQVAKPQQAATKAQFAQITELRKEIEELQGRLWDLTYLLAESKTYKSVRGALAVQLSDADPATDHLVTTDTPETEKEVA